MKIIDTIVLYTNSIFREKDVVDKGIFIGHQIEEQRTVAHLIIRQFIETFASTATLCTEWVKKALAIYLSYFIMEEVALLYIFQH